MSPAERRISTRFRLALAAKGALLLWLCAVFAALSLTALVRDGAWWWRVPAVAVFVTPVRFLFSTARLALVDAWYGVAVCTVGAVALASRRMGYSLQLPDGRYVEFILWNPWAPLAPGRAYTVVYGARSLVLVEPPLA